MSSVQFLCQIPKWGLGYLNLDYSSDPALKGQNFTILSAALRSLQRKHCDTPTAPDGPIFSYCCGQPGTLEPGSRSAEQPEPLEPCARAAPPLAPASLRDPDKAKS